LRGIHIRRAGLPDSGVEAPASAPDLADDHFVGRNGTPCAGAHLVTQAERLDHTSIERTFRSCVDASGATLVHIHLHRFEPNGGVSGVAVLAESHISVEFAKRHFPEFTTPVFADARFERVIGDGARYVAETKRRFDVVIVDSTDPQGAAAVLFTRDFYAACKRCMKRSAVLVTLPAGHGLHAGARSEPAPSRQRALAQSARLRHRRHRIGGRAARVYCR
jgi:S-adenosylmethionine/arginine decarboxylase-like enzyme